MFRFVFYSFMALSSGFQKSDDFMGASALELSPHQLIRKQIEQSFHLNRKQSQAVLHAQIKNAIREAAPKAKNVSGAYQAQLAREIVKHSHCFGIDPIVFTSLIWKESRFVQSAVSPTGAVGITQMTKPGVQEVLERLSPTSSRRLGYLRSQVKKCAPLFLREVPYEVSADTVAAFKNKVSFSSQTALIAGLVHFKLNLASVRSGRATLRMEDRYRLALERYNGDARVKRIYAKEVLSLARAISTSGTLALENSRSLRWSFY